MAASLEVVGFSEIRDNFKFGGLFGVAEEDGSGISADYDAAVQKDRKAKIDELTWDSKEDANAWKTADTFWTGWGANVPSCVALSIALA